MKTKQLRTCKGCNNEPKVYSEYCSRCEAERDNEQRRQFLGEELDSLIDNADTHPSIWRAINILKELINSHD